MDIGEALPSTRAAYVKAKPASDTSIVGLSN